MVRRLVRRLPSPVKTLQFAKWIWPRQQRPQRRFRAQTLECRLRTHSKVYEASRGARAAKPRRHRQSSPPPGARTMFPTSAQLLRQLALLLAEIALRPSRRRSGRSDRPSRRSISSSKSRNVRPSRSATACATVDLSRARKPDEDQVRLRTDQPPSRAAMCER